MQAGHTSTSTANETPVRPLTWLSALLPSSSSYLLHLHHVELEPLQVKEQDVREPGDARTLQSVPLLVALRAQELVVPGEHLRVKG